MSSPGSDANEYLPPVDEHMVAPGGRYECDDGDLVEVTPADPPHATANANLAWLLRAHVAPDFDVAVDMLTRTSRRDDIAPDGSVFPRALDPETGGRQLEHLAFEIASTQTLARAASKAARLAGRGVRRVFAIDLVHVRVLEWSRDLATWSILDASTHIEDPALAVALPISALLHAIDADAAVARALLARRHPIIESEIDAATDRGRAEGRTQGKIEGKIEGMTEGKTEGMTEGRLEGLAAALLAVLAARGFPITPVARHRIEDERDPDRLERWVGRAGTCASIDELLSSP